MPAALEQKSFTDFAPPAAAVGFDTFIEPTLVQRTTSAAKAFGGEAASLADLVLSLPGFAVGWGANVGAQAFATGAGESPKIAAQAGREAAERIGGPLMNPLEKVLQLFDSEDIYKEAKTTQGMQKVASLVEQAGEWVEKTTKGKVPAEQVSNFVDTLMLGLGTRGTSVAKDWMARKAPPRVDPGIGSEIGGMPKPRIKGPPAVVQEALTFESFAAGKPRIKPKASGEVDPALLAWLATGAALTTAGGLIYAEHKRSGRDLLDIIKDPKGPAAAPAEEEPQPTERGTFLSKVPEWLVGGAMIVGAVKGKGGTWHPEAVERLSSPLANKLINREGGGDPVLARMEAAGADQPRDLPESKWATRAIRNYLNKYAGTKEDPLRDIEIPVGGDMIARRWEDVWDRAVATVPGENVPGGRKGEAVYDVRDTQRNAGQSIISYLSHVGDYLRQSVPPEKLQQYDLVRAVKETADADKRAAAAMEKATAASMKDMPVYKAYPDGYKWVELKLPEKLTEEQAKQVRKANLRETKELIEGEDPQGEVRAAQIRESEGWVAIGSDKGPIRNSYTDSIVGGPTPEEAWLAGRLAEEGNIMGHCVGGYCAGVASGESRIFSLRDPKGRSHVTVEVEPPTKYMKGTARANSGELPSSITQIKGKQNRAPSSEYLPYVQDFVKSGPVVNQKPLFIDKSGNPVGDLKGPDAHGNFMQDKGIDNTPENAAKQGWLYVDSSGKKPLIIAGSELYNAREAELAAQHFADKSGQAVDLQFDMNRYTIQPKESPKWGEVGDLQNAGLVDLQHKVQDKGFVEFAKSRFGDQRFVSGKEADDLWRQYVKDTAGSDLLSRSRPRGEEGSASPELLKHLAALGLGAAAGSYLSSDHPVYGAVIGAIAGLSLSALRRPNTLLERELRQSVEQAIRAVSPESLGPKAKQAAALIAKAISERMQKNSAIYHSSEGRRRYWDKHSDQQTPFIRGFERGWTPKDPTLKAITTFYREWADRIFKQDAKLGIEYEQRDNYLYHVFEDGDKVAQFFEQKYGAKWGDPRFSKARGFDLYDEAIKAGYKPRTTNPEEIMLMRQFASNVAEMRINALRDMEKYGLARTVKGNARELGDVQWRSPNGDLYWVHEHAAQILHNAFDTPSLWNMKGALGAGFRAAMYTKNTLVPVILNLSLFHPLHLSLGMDNSAAMLRASKELVAGTSTPAQYIGRMARYGNPITAIYDSVWTNPKAGWRPFKLWKGQVPAEAITEADRLILQYTHEGGFVPEMSKEYRTGAIESFKKAWDQNSLTAIPKFALAVPQWLQKPLFEYWIPSLKYASYLNDVKTALKTNPALLDDPVSRGVAFRKLAKSVENRYGEMAYDTLFWNRIIRDLGVANTLSLGWSLGFFREYGGALSEAGQASVKLDLKGRVARGELDRAMFVAMYTTNTALYGGLLTWALTGKPPTQWMDYFYPRTGDKNPDGSDSRVNTMFYSRELLGMWKHAQNEGVLPGIGQFLTNKLAPTWGIAKGLWSNMDFMGREISDPNSSAFKQLAQKVQWAMQEVTPISIQSIRKSPEITAKTVALGVTGFAPAPRYATETPVEGKIAAVFRQYHKSTTPYERARYSEEVGELYKLRQKGDTDKFYDKLQELREKHHLTHEQVRRIRRESQIPGTERMFRALTEEQQEKLLRSMSPEEREKYSRLAHRKLKRKLRSEQ